MTSCSSYVHVLNFMHHHITNLSSRADPLSPSVTKTDRMCPNYAVSCHGILRDNHSTPPLQPAPLRQPVSLSALAPTYFGTELDPRRVGHKRRAAALHPRAGGGSFGRPLLGMPPRGVYIECPRPAQIGGYGVIMKGGRWVVCRMVDVMLVLLARVVMNRHR